MTELLVKTELFPCYLSYVKVKSIQAKKLFLVQWMIDYYKVTRILKLEKHWQLKNASSLFYVKFNHFVIWLDDT
jgi:hypothetical protein